MRASDFEDRLRKSRYKILDKETYNNGIACYAEKRLVAGHEDGPAWDMVWGSGPDEENMEIAQRLIMKDATSHAHRMNKVREQAKAFLELRDHSGDSRRR